jgi:signal recognition particle GTPase
MTGSCLPPLSPYFVVREDIKKAMDEALIRLRDDSSNKTMVLLGMGGSGKTQSISKFMQDHKDQ